jgi:gamma-glutamyl-gamma-aminobutyrate hydrolase PuuD
MNKILTVYIEGERRGSYHDMWQRWGYTPIGNPLNADVIQFTGGEDVNPSLYGEAVHPTTYFSRDRDELCIELFQIGKANNIPMAGICRGGQFLNVINGGKMFQDCDGHGVFGTHKATIRESGLIVDVTSTHHQIMRPSEDGIVLLEAEKLGNYKEHITLNKELSDKWMVWNNNTADDIESVYYEASNSLCYQPHPEYCDENSSCVQTYKSFLRNYLGLQLGLVV